MLTKTSAVENFLIREIQKGSFPVGSKIPSRSKLCSQFKCSRTVIERAVDTLEKNGYLSSRHGSGTFVTAASPQNDKIQQLKIICDFNININNISFLPILKFDDLNISVEWINYDNSITEFENISRQGTAIIALRPKINQLPLLEKLKRRNIPVLLLNRDYEGFDHIITDPQSSIREGISWLLIEAGREIAFVSHRPSTGRPYIAERILSFYEAATEFGAKLRSDWCLSRNFHNFTEELADTGQKLFGSVQHPSGIFILDLDLVLPVVNCGQGYGFTPGKDYKLLTFDNVPELEDRHGIAMLKQPDLLYDKEIRRWIKSIGSAKPFQVSLKTELKVKE